MEKILHIYMSNGMSHNNFFLLSNIAHYKRRCVQILQI